MSMYLYPSTDDSECLRFMAKTLCLTGAITEIQKQ